MFVHDIIKAKYSTEGYLPDWPPHLISDEEMCKAFMNPQEQTGYFYDEYPEPQGFAQEYSDLQLAISYHISQFISSNTILPDWVYTYMLGEVIGTHSDTRDIHDFLILLGTDNLDDVYDAQSMVACYDASKTWIHRIPESLEYVVIEVDGASRQIALRPPTIFGESHVIKFLRLRDVDLVNR